MNTRPSPFSPLVGPGGWPARAAANQATRQAARDEALLARSAQDAREQAMYGMSEESARIYLQHGMDAGIWAAVPALPGESDQARRLRIAVGSLLSDAQEMMHSGELDKARKLMNIAKYALFQPAQVIPSR